jgi:hypothetical protein
MDSTYSQGALRRFASRGWVGAPTLAVKNGGEQRANRLAGAWTVPVNRVELTDVSFFPQPADQCGPAALAMILTATGMSVTPQALSQEIHAPLQRETLQLELTAATRRRGRIPYVLRPRLEDLVCELKSGTPVLVLQNLAFSWYPKWHCAVLVGFDPARGEIILRSGCEARQTLPLRLFQRTWKRGDCWAMVAVAPHRLPFTADETPYLRAVGELEQLQRWQDAASAYAACVARWPDNPVAKLGLARSRQAMGDLRGAETVCRQAIHDHCDFAPAFDSLAQVLAEQGRLQEAEHAAKRAVAIGGSSLKQYENTLSDIASRHHEAAKH